MRLVKSKKNNDLFRDQHQLAKITLHSSLERNLASVALAKRGRAQKRSPTFQLKMNLTSQRSMESLLATDFAPIATNDYKTSQF